MLLAAQWTGSQEIVRLQAGATAIPVADGGKLVELLNTAPEITLPRMPVSNGTGSTWTVALKNLGPHTVTIRNGDQFVLPLRPNDRVSVAWRGSGAYVRLH
jgi:hypothetical protein